MLTNKQIKIGLQGSETCIAAQLTPGFINISMMIFPKNLTATSFGQGLPSPEHSLIYIHSFIDNRATKEISKLTKELLLFTHLIKIRIR